MTLDEYWELPPEVAKQVDEWIELHLGTLMTCVGVWVEGDEFIAEQITNMFYAGKGPTGFDLWEIPEGEEVETERFRYPLLAPCPVIGLPL